MDKQTRLSATHAEYREAENLGLTVSVWARDVDDMNADQYRFLQEVRTFHTTGSFTEADDLVEKVRRRFLELAADTISPWVKLGEVVMRARTVVDNGSTIIVRASVHAPEVSAALEAMRPETFRTQDEHFTWAGKCVPVRVNTVETTTSAARSTAVEIVLERLDSRGSGSALFTTASSFTTNARTFTSEELTVLHVRHVLFGEEQPPGAFGFAGGFSGASGGDFAAALKDLPAENLPAARYQAVFSLVVTEALVKAGYARRVDRAQVSPPGPEGRRVRLSWAPRGDGARSVDPLTVQGTIAHP